MSREAKERFSRVHKHYDFFNHLFSLGTDIQWRNEAAKEAMIPKKEYSVLDIATGTGDLAVAVYKTAKSKGKTIALTGMDFNEAMLSHAKEKTEKLGIPIKIDVGDALHTKYGDSSFEVVTSGFALRNFDDLTVFSKELRRIMKKGGKFVLLDMAMPYRGRAFMKAYFKVMESVGSVVNKNAYRFLTHSIMAFDRENMAKILNEQGFRSVKIRNLSYGMAFIITGYK